MDSFLFKIKPNLHLAGKYDTNQKQKKDFSVRISYQF